MDEIRISADRLRYWGVGLLEIAGVAKSDAIDVMDSLVDTQLRGIDTHGIVHLGTYLQRVKKVKMNPLQIIKETKNTCLIDGGSKLGHIVGTFAMKKAIDIASKNKMGAVAVRNSNHFGAAGYYSKMAASKGYLGFVTTNGSARVAPWGGADPIIGNNPYSIALPGIEFPIVFDMAVTVTSGSKLVVAKREGKKIPLGWAMDKNGIPTTDPEKALEGILMPVGGYKGVGISVMIDLICGLLSNGSFSYEVTRAEKTDSSQNVSHFFFVIDISQFVDKEAYMRSIGEFIKNYKNVRFIDGYKDVYMPGEIEWNCEVDRRKSGIPFTLNAIKQANKIAKEFEHDLLFKLE